MRKAHNGLLNSGIKNDNSACHNDSLKDGLINDSEQAVEMWGNK